MMYECMIVCRYNYTPKWFMWFICDIVQSSQCKTPLFHIYSITRIDVHLSIAAISKCLRTYMYRYVTVAR